MTERMMQYASDFTSLWFDAMGVVMGGMNGQSGGSTSRFPDVDAQDPRQARPTRAPGPLPGAAGSRWVIEMKSARPMEVIVTLDEASGPAELVLEPLRSRSGRVTITDVSLALPLEPSAPTKLRVHAPKGAPTGRYTSPILDAKTRKAVGRLTVTLAK